MTLIQSVYFCKPFMSNHRRYQNDVGAVYVRPYFRPDLSKVSLIVFIMRTKFGVSSGWPPRSGAPGYSQSISIPFDQVSICISNYWLLHTIKPICLHEFNEVGSKFRPVCSRSRNVSKHGLGCGAIVREGPPSDT
jgi:hypothetical protein